MLFTRENRQDIAKYYSNTFVKFKEHCLALENPLPADTLFFIEHVGDSQVTGKAQDGKPFIIWLSDTFPFEADYVLPHKSFFQFNGVAMLLERVPAQQYFRGLCAENTKMTYLGTNGQVKVHHIGFDTLMQFVTKQKFYSLKEAIAATGNVSSVLSPRMQYCNHNQCIYVDHIPVAHVVVHKKEITMSKSIFREEVQDLLSAYNETDFIILDKKPVVRVEKEKEVAL